MWLAITLPGIKSVYVLRAQNTLHFYIGPCSELAGSVQSAVSIMQSRNELKHIEGQDFVREQLWSDTILIVYSTMESYEK